MAEQILDQIRDVAEGQIDFDGQTLAEQLGTVSLVIAGCLSFVIGYIQQDIKLALWVGLGGTAATFLLVVPPWPFFNKNPTKWLPLGGSATHLSSQAQTVVFDTKGL